MITKTLTAIENETACLSLEIAARTAIVPFPHSPVIYDSTDWLASPLASQLVKLQMIRLQSRVALSAIFLIAQVWATQTQESLPDAPSHTLSVQGSKSQPSKPVESPSKAVDGGWPRELDRGTEKVSMYQPQVENWQGNEIRAYAALSVVDQKDKTTKYGT